MKSSSSFILNWVFVTAFSSMIGFAAGFSLESDDYYLPLSLLLSFSFSGLICGFGQWLILRTKMKKLNLWMWIPATAIGLPLGIFNGFWVQDYLNFLPILDGAWHDWMVMFIISTVAGIVMGIFQWFALYGLPRPVWFLLSSASLMGIPIFYLQLNNPIFRSLNQIILVSIFGGLWGIVLGIVSGFNIKIMLERYETQYEIHG